MLNQPPWCVRKFPRWLTTVGCRYNGVQYIMILHKSLQCLRQNIHDDVIKWKHFPRNWPFVRGIHRSPVNSPHKGQWLGALMFSLICVWINGWVNNREAGDLRRHRGHYDVSVMKSKFESTNNSSFFVRTDEIRGCFMDSLEKIYRGIAASPCFIFSNYDGLP